ncbi:glycosyltransferase family 2 protein [Psychroflexus planctonicus]|uniref:Glycosyl transferase n=1 Tax=Psychroflexus planctonicus TaxID=1526575 RepID=A0ABQ1SEA9_9FLAO|nr:glycosyltransferase family 2 protein [Psychroflexus planctonicus]GGE33360.1 glycosyl transferase [Psychroflexus planctonicus]
MLSILIPNFNDQCQNLVYSLVDEIEKLNAQIEIIIGDDASTLAHITETYTKFEEFTNVHIIQNQSNLGREKTRIKLADEAKNNWLLFLDADVFPQQKNYISNYVEAIQKNNELDVIFGGIAYQEKPKDKNYLLRWKYGKAREEQNLIARTENKYRSLVTGAICIKKSVFLKHSTVLEHIYGLDILLAYQLKKANANVLHINNPVFHLGLETNSVFLSKTKDAWKSLILLEDKNLISKDFRPIQKAYLKLKKLRLLNLCKWLYKLFHVILCKQITGKSPSLFWFDVYRMLYFCYLKELKSIENE